MIRSAFASAVADEPDLEIVGDAATRAEGLAGAPPTRPDVLVVDLALPDGDGVHLIPELRRLLPSASVLVLSGCEDEYRVAEALRAGANGYLLKSAQIHELMAAIRTVASGGTPISPCLTGAVLRAMRRTGRGSSGTIEALTAREVQVLQLLATGLSTREVASTLGISPKTVETHRIRIYDKLGCKSVIDLARIAVRTGLVRA